MASVGRIAAIICGFIMILACSLYIISNVLPLWGSKQIKKEKTTVGLWSICESSNGTTNCFKRASTCSEVLDEALPMCKKMMVSRAFITIACIISALSALCLFAYAIIITRTNLNRIVMIISKILPLVSLVAGVIGLAVGIVFITTPPLIHKIDVAAITGISAVAINTIGALFALLIR